MVLPALPAYIPWLFIGCTLWCLLIWGQALKAVLSRRALLATGVGLAAWMGLQALLGSIGFYATVATPPRFPLLVMPMLVAFAVLLGHPRSRAVLLQTPVSLLLWVHVVRIPVEIVLYWLAHHGAVPPVMTFEGTNFDILSGLTALAMLRWGQHHRTALLIWNFVCLGLLLNIVTTAILAAPSPFQQLAFDQPNIAIAFFPYGWLPSVVVPAVLLAHLVGIAKAWGREG